MKELRNLFLIRVQSCFHYKGTVMFTLGDWGGCRRGLTSSCCWWNLVWMRRMIALKQDRHEEAVFTPQDGVGSVKWPDCPSVTGQAFRAIWSSKHSQQNKHPPLCFIEGGHWASCKIFIFLSLSLLQLMLFWHPQTKANKCSSISSHTVRKYYCSCALKASFGVFSEQ